MSLLNSLKKLVHHFDLFCSSQLLRYNSQTQYKTLTGGLLSLSIIIVIVVGFASMISQTLQRSSITSSLTTIKQSKPPLASLKPGKQGMFMVGLSIQSWDLSYLADFFSGPQYFTLTMDLVKITNGVPTWTAVALEQCTKQHWSMMPEFSQNFDGFGIGKWACLPLGTEIPIQGAYISAINELAVIKVYRCQNSSLNNNSCASEQEIDTHFSTYQNFYLTYNYVNPVINPNLQEYKSYYIQANDYVVFSKTVGAQPWVFFSDYQINTDNSIWPFQDINIEYGCIVEEKAINHPYGIVNNSAFASIYLAKSVNSLVYKREVRKISAVFSYIGGLVGAITAVLFFINMYTDSSLQVTIGLSLFEEKQQKKSQEDKQVTNFNFFGFSRLSFYRFVRLFGWKGSWEIPQKLEKYQNEAVKQLDVELLLRRLIKLEACMTHIFTHEELQQIKQGQRITVENAKQMRKLLMKDETLKQQNIGEVLNAESAISMGNDNRINHMENEGVNNLRIEEASHFSDGVQPSGFSLKGNQKNIIRLPEEREFCKSSKKVIPKNLKIHSMIGK